MVGGLGGEESTEWRLPKWAPSGKPGAAEGMQLRGAWQVGGENLKNERRPGL